MHGLACPRLLSSESNACVVVDLAWGFLCISLCFWQLASIRTWEDRRGMSANRFHERLDPLKMIIRGFRAHWRLRKAALWWLCGLQVVKIHTKDVFLSRSKNSSYPRFVKTRMWSAGPFPCSHLPSKHLRIGVLPGSLAFGNNLDILRICFWGHTRRPMHVLSGLFHFS